MDLNDNLNLFVARGPFRGNQVNQHKDIPLISPEALVLLSEDYRHLSGAKVNALIKAHGMLR